MQHPLNAINSFNVQLTLGLKKKIKRALYDLWLLMVTVVLIQIPETMALSQLNYCCTGENT